MTLPLERLKTTHTTHSTHKVEIPFWAGLICPVTHQLASCGDGSLVLCQPLTEFPHVDFAFGGVALGSDSEQSGPQLGVLVGDLNMSLVSRDWRCSSPKQLFQLSNSVIVSAFRGSELRSLACLATGSAQPSQSSGSRTRRHQAPKLDNGLFGFGRLALAR